MKQTTTRRKHRNYTPCFQAKVALAALLEEFDSLKRGE
jgi:hypothetical protein